MTDQHRHSELVGSLASSSTYNEAFDVCTDGYCLFDAERRLLSYSTRLADFYPAIREDVVIGMHYEDYLRLFVEKRAVKNLGDISNIDHWLAERTNPDITQGTFLHHLHDDRWLQIKFRHLTGGQWLFTALDVTQHHQQTEELQRRKVRFRKFARLSSDWFWELDENLRYKFHSSFAEESKPGDFTVYEGRTRIQLLEQSAVHDDQLHLQISQLRRRERVDAVIEWNTAPWHGVFIHVVAEPQFDEHGIFTGYLGCGRDVSNESRLQRQLKELAEYDDLTGIRNRRSFEEHLNQTIASLHYDWQPKTLAYIDLDRFKQVNDGSGHQAGDELLKHVARSLQRIVQPNAVIGRLGGDEFGVIFNRDIDEAFDLVSDFIRSISATEFVWKERQYLIGASVGMTTINDYQSDPSELMKQADTACYSAKNSGRNQARIFTHRATRGIMEKIEPVYLQLLRDALKNNSMVLALQPVKAIRMENEQKWFEVLVSVPDASGRVVPASELMPVAEKYQLTAELDRWVLVKAIEYIIRFRELDVNVFLSVNLSGHSLSHPEFMQWIENTLLKADIEPANLGLEFAESSAINNLSSLADFSRKLRQQGYRIALDDFGSQSSSFDYIRNLPLDFLKIDGNVITEMTHNATCRVIVSTFIQLSHELGIETIAEYVEDRETEALLLKAGVDYVQGFGVGKPQLAEYWIDLYRPTRRKTDDPPFPRQAAG